MGKKLIHYSRTGYNGGYTYTSVCDKEVKTHQDNEESITNPQGANCKKCMATKEYKTDLNDYSTKGGEIKRRIYIESDNLHADEFSSAQDNVLTFLKKDNLKYVDRVFSDVLDYAWHDLEKTWAAVKDADEIYATSSLIPLCGNSYMGAPVIFNGMCERAIKENITGKSVIIFNTLENINWYMINVKQMKEAFKNNSLYMYNEDYDIEKIYIDKIKFPKK